MSDLYYWMIAALISGVFLLAFILLNEKYQFLKGIKKKSYQEKFEKLFTKINVPLHQQVTHLSMSMAGLNLDRDEYFMAVTPHADGVYKGFGIRCMGGLWPVFTYVIFDQEIMDFIEITAEINQPAELRYKATITCENKNQPEHGKVIEVKDFYKVPFEKFMKYCYFYFPLYNNFAADKRIKAQNNRGVVNEIPKV